MAININITQGVYWKGGQIPYWLYMVFVILPFTGLFGVDHLLLRSPITAILKFLSIIPLFGFWYFYDMAQLGERELIEKNGIGVPFYGPIGLGAGIFTAQGQPISSPDIARPWRFVAYTMATLLFVTFPINKFVLGDYWGALAQCVMYFLFPLTFLAIIWGFYDAFRIVFDTQGVFESGASRVFPASWLMDANFNRAALGPFSTIPHDPSKDSWFRRFFSAAVEVPITVLKAEVGLVKAADAATVGVVSVAAETAKGVVTTSGEMVKDVVVKSGTAVETVVEGSAGAVAGAASAAENVVGLVGKLPTIVEKIGTGLGDPNVLMAAAKQGKSLPQSGGALLSMNPSVSSTALIFGVALLAFSGYVIHTLRNTRRKNTEENDTPPDPSTVRRTTKAFNAGW